MTVHVLFQTAGTFKRLLTLIASVNLLLSACVVLIDVTRQGRLHPVLFTAIRTNVALLFHVYHPPVPSQFQKVFTNQFTFRTRKPGVSEAHVFPEVDARGGDVVTVVARPLFLDGVMLPQVGPQPSVIPKHFVTLRAGKLRVQM